MVDSAERLIVGLILEGFPLGERGKCAPPRPGAADWAWVAETAVHHGLAPLLYASLKRNERLDEVPPDSAEQLRADYFRASVANMVAYQELAHILDSFEPEHVPVVLLKGTAVAMRLYPDPGLRPFSDLDLLIPETQVTNVRTLLARRGYSPLPEMTRGFEQRFSSQQAYSRNSGIPAQVDLHWHLFVIAYYRKRIPIDWFWQHTTAFEIYGRSVRAFAPEAQLLHLSAHYKLHHHAERLIWLYDLALLVDRHRDDMNWEEVLEAVRAFGLTRPVQAAIAQMEHSWGVSLPAEVARRLEAIRPAPYERLLFALTSGGDSQARVVLDGFDLPTPHAKLQFWLRHMFPTPEYMCNRYHISNSRLVPLYYPWRIISGGYMALRSLLATFKQGLTSQVRNSEK